MIQLNLLSKANLKSNLLLRIYGLENPDTKEIVYIGATTHSLSHRLKQHYWQLNEAKNTDRRNMNKRFEYLDKLLPKKVNIVLLYETDDVANLKQYESEYIEKYRKINPNLLNETDGGYGNNTHKYKSDSEIKNCGIKISNSLKGRKKPKGFAEHLSDIRKGLGNPMVKKLNELIYAVDFNKQIIKEFNYGFEINTFLNINNAWSNVKKVLDGKQLNAYGYFWIPKSKLNKFIKV